MVSSSRFLKLLVSLLTTLIFSVAGVYTPVFASNILFSNQPLRSFPSVVPLAVPTLQAVAPLSNTHTVPSTTTVSITYNEAISFTTVNTRTFAVHAMQTGLLSQTYTVTDGLISLTPSHPFKPGELVQVSATTGTLNLVGQEPVSPTVWQFRVAALGGSGFFKYSEQGLENPTSESVSLGDLDNDGDIDAFVVNTNVNGFYENTIWLNTGENGVLVQSPHRMSGSNYPDMAGDLGDVDGDGDLDAFVVSGTKYKQKSLEGYKLEIE